MKQISIFVMLLCLSMTSRAQQLPRAIVSAGGTASGSSGISAFVIGQPFGGTITGSGGTLFHGVLSPFMISVATGIEEAQGIKLEIACKVYPNPTTDYVNLSINNYDLKDLQYRLYDMSGRVLNLQHITSDVTQIPMGNLRPGIYLVAVLDDSRIIKQFKVSKIK